MINRGIITKAENEILTVVFDRPEACGECHACNRGSESCAKHTIEMKGNGSVGDIVEVEIDDDHVVLASAIAYLIPLAGLIIGMVAGFFVSKSLSHVNEELVSAVGGIVGVAIGYMSMHLLNPRLSKGRWQPHIVRIEKPIEKQ